MTKTPAPRHLTVASKRLWAEVVAEFDLTPAERRILQVACEAWDRMSQARETLAEAGGPVYLDRFGAPRKHPSVTIEQDARSAFVRAVHELGLDPELGTPAVPRLDMRRHADRQRAARHAGGS